MGRCLERQHAVSKSECNRSKYILMFHSHLWKLIQICTKYYAAHANTRPSSANSARTITVLKSSSKIYQSSSAAHSLVLAVQLRDQNIIKVYESCYFYSWYHCITIPVKCFVNCVMGTTPITQFLSFLPFLSLWKSLQYRVNRKVYFLDKITINP